MRLNNDDFRPARTRKVDVDDDRAASDPLNRDDALQDEAYEASSPASTAPGGTNAKGSRLLPLLFGGVGIFVIGGVFGYVAAHRIDDPALATVNGVEIDKQEYSHRCETTIVNNAAVGPQVLRQMVMDDLAIQYATKQGVSPTDADIDAKYLQASKAANFTENIKKSLQTPEDIKHAIRASLAQSNVLTKGITVSDQEVQEFYKSNTDPRNTSARYYRPDTAQLALIATDKEADIDSAIHALATGYSFAQVAQKYSKDRSAANGGLLPPIPRGKLDAKRFPGLENRLFALKPNDQIDKVKVGNQFWLVRCIARGVQSTVPFNQVKEECHQGALLVKGARTNGQTVHKDYQEFVNSADIKALQPQFHDAVNLTGKP